MRLAGGSLASFTSPACLCLTSLCFKLPASVTLTWTWGWRAAASPPSPPRPPIHTRIFRILRQACWSILYPLLMSILKMIWIFSFWWWWVFIFGGCWPLLCLCRSFFIFERCLHSNAESCRSKQLRYQLSHPSHPMIKSIFLLPCLVQCCGTGTGTGTVGTVTFWLLEPEPEPEL